MVLWIQKLLGATNKMKFFPTIESKGQTLLVVVFAMSLGLLVVVHTSLRSLNSIARTTQTNYFQKATAAASSGAEELLLKDIYGEGSLDDYAKAGGSFYCPVLDLQNLQNVRPECIINFSEARAFIGVESYPVQAFEQEKIERLRFTSKPGEVLHINLVNISPQASFIQVCWKGLGFEKYSVSQFFYYYGDLDGYGLDKGSYLCNESFSSWCQVPASDVRNINQAQANGEYSCYSVNLRNKSVAFRILTFPDSAEYLISAHENSYPYRLVNFPQQGFRIVSIGEVLSGSGFSLPTSKATRKMVVVERTFPYPKSYLWDFALSSGGKIEP